MLTAQQEEHRLMIKVPSQTCYLNEVLNTCRSFLYQQGERDVAKATIVLRELLMNAIIHGNKQIPDRMVALVVSRIGKSCYSIDMEDEGTGFNSNSLDLHLPESGEKVIHRGLSLVNALTEKLLFEGNGNRIIAVVDLCLTTPEQVDHRWHKAGT